MDLVIFGMSSYAEIAALYFSRSTEFKPVAFCIDDHYVTSSEFQGLPVVPSSRIVSEFNPSLTYFHVAATYTNLNRLRRDKVLWLMGLGYKPASYVSADAYVDPTAQIGEHVFIFEHNTIQAKAVIHDRVVLWSGNHIGHHSVVHEDVFVSSHVVISGHCSVGPRTFLGVNSSIGNGVNIGGDNWIMPGTVLLRDTDPNQMWRPTLPTLSSVTPISKFVPE